MLTKHTSVVRIIVFSVFNINEFTGRTFNQNSATLKTPLMITFQKLFYQNLSCQTQGAVLRVWLSGCSLSASANGN